MFQQSISRVQGSIQLIQGNCLEELPRIKATEDKFIIVTDPPFNVGYHYNTYKDSMDNDAYYEMLGDVFQYAPFVVIHYPEEIYKIAFQVGEFPDKVVSWVYNSNTPKQHRDIAFFGVKPDFTKYGQPYKNPTDKRIMKRIADGKTAKLYDWWEINQVKNVSKKDNPHPCPIPYELAKRIILSTTKEGDTICDPFAGSGTVLLAARDTGRKFIGFELDDIYCDYSRKLLS